MTTDLLNAYCFLVTVRPPRELGRDSPRFLSETTHMVLHGVAAVIFLILVITLVCVLCMKRYKIIH